MGKWAAVEVRLSTTAKNIPYRAEPEDDIHPVIWLSREPARIDEIPELARDSSLKEAIRAINAPDGRFETFRCGSVQEAENGEHSSVFNIGLMYRDRNAFADYSAQLMIAGELLGFSAESPIFEDTSKPFFLEMEPVTLTTENRQGWAFDIWHRSVAATAEEARTLSDQALAFVADVLSRTYR